MFWSDRCRTLVETIMSNPIVLPAIFAILLQAPSPRVPAAVDTAIARMGGAQTLERVQRVRLDMMTQWQRTSFENLPYADGPSYEHHTDLRNYTMLAWRNTRRFGFGPQAREVADVVHDTVAIRRFGAAWQPLNVAYVDERRELFAFAPERVLLKTRDARDLRAVADTTIGGTAHARVSATIDGFPSTLFLRRTDGFLAMARFRAAHPNDFGLVPWGRMEVEVWYSRWAKHPTGVVYPMQLDVRRVGRPYKRMTVLSANFDAPAPADSFAVSDSLRTAFFATANKPMHDLPLDSARIVEQRFASFGTFGAPMGAVKLGNQWVLLEGGQASLSTERAVRWLERTDAGTRVTDAVVSTGSIANGGVAWLAEQRLTTHVASGAKPFIDVMLRNHGQSSSATKVVTNGRWLRVGTDSMWLEPIDLPDAAGSMIAYVPSLTWVYNAMAASPLHLDLVLARARARGWTVERYGSARAVMTKVMTP
jgi:hypothetical protein